MDSMPSLPFQMRSSCVRTPSKSQAGISASRFARACSMLMNEVPTFASTTRPAAVSKLAYAPTFGPVAVVPPGSAASRRYTPCVARLLLNLTTK